MQWQIIWDRAASVVRRSTGALVVSRTRGVATCNCPRLPPLPTASSSARFYHRSPANPLAKGRGGDTNDGAASHSENKAKKHKRRSKGKGKTKENKNAKRVEAEMKEWGVLEGEHKYTPGSTIRNQKEQNSYFHRRWQQQDDSSSKKSKGGAIIPSLLFASQGQMLPPEIISAMQADPTYFHGRHGVATRWTPPSKSGGSSTLVTVLQQIQREQQQTPENVCAKQDDE